MPTAFNNAPIREHSNEIARLLRPRHQRRRPDQEGQDLVVRHLSRAVQRGGAAELPRSTRRSTRAVERGRQGHLPGQPEEQVDRLLPVGPEGAAEPPAVRDLHLRLDPSQTYKQDSGSWVYKGEWNGTVSDKLYVEARYGDFGYYFPLIANSDDNFFWRDTGRAGARRRAPEAAARSRPQAVHRRGDLLPRHRARAATRSSSAASC